MLILRSRTALLGIASSLAGIACAAGQADSPLALYSGQWNEDDALLTGTLAREAECLYIVDSRGVKWLPAFAARGTSWNEAEESVTYVGKTIRVGDQVKVGGSSPLAVEIWAAPPEGSCDSTRIWLVSDS